MSKSVDCKLCNHPQDAIKVHDLGKIIPCPKHKGCFTFVYWWHRAKPPLSDIKIMEKLLERYTTREEINGNGPFPPVNMHHETINGTHFAVHLSRG